MVGVPPEELAMVSVPPVFRVPPFRVPPFRVNVPPVESITNPAQVLMIATLIGESIAALLMNALAFSPRDTGLPVTWNATLLPPAPAPI